MTYLRHILVVTCVTSLILLTACTGSDSSDSRGPSPTDSISIDSYSEITAKLNFENGTAQLPLDTFRNQTSESVARAYHAIDSITSVCLLNKGLSPITDSRGWTVQTPQSDRTFGQWDVAEAQQFGLTPDPSRGRPTTDTLELGVETNAALPECMEDAKQRLATQLAFDQQQGIDVQIDQSAYEHTMADPAGKSALSKRAKCMSEQGIIVAQDTQLPSFQYDSKPLDEKIRVATIEAKCSVDTGAVQELYDLEARYQTAYITQYEAQLVALQRQAQRNADELDQVIERAAHGQVPEKQEESTEH